MLETHWLLLVGFGVLMMLLWLIVSDDEKVNFTAGFGGVAFLLAALTAPGVERMTETGDVVQASVGVVVQLFVGLLALLSLIVIVLYHFDEYPPNTEEDLDE